MSATFEIAKIKDQDRSKKIEEFEIMDSLAEKEFDDIVELAAAICNVPISLISLIDNKRQWFKAKVGIEESETDRSLAFCDHAIKNPDEVLIVRNALEDDRFKNNPLVKGGPCIRFYAGAPIVSSDNFALGTLCVIDSKPRDFSEEEQRLLRALADKIMEMIELRRDNIIKEKELESSKNELQITLSRLLEAQSTARIGSWDWYAKTNEFYWSPEMFKLFNVKRKDKALVSYAMWKSLIAKEDFPSLKAVIEKCISNKISGEVEFRLKSSGDTEVWLLSKGNIITDDLGNIIRVHGTVQDITRRKQAQADKELYLNALEEMLFGLSHKIRQPVANLLGLISSLETTNLTPEKMKEYARYFQVSANELDNFIREMTNFIHENKVSLGA
ncbi:MAG: PAS domain-containing protein [Chitinophagales bacterium]|nr:PAS domain-containing protein [Chitinophagales bacterium]